jgi:hypothetical protein
LSRYPQSRKRAHLIDTLVVELITAGDVLLAHSMVHVGLDAAGSDSVDRDLLVTEVDGHAPDEGLDGTLGGGVDGVLGDSLGLASDGSHENETAADREVLVGLARDEELATGVDVEDAVELLGGHILDVAEGDDTRVGADDVELAELLDGLLEEFDDLVDVRHVSLDGGGIGAVLLDEINDLVGGRVAVGVVDNDLGAATSKLKSHLTADTTACAC